MLASCASHRRLALSATVSSTGWISVGERLITRRISAVAVCCSSDSVRSAFLACSSPMSRAFSIAIMAWSANVWASESSAGVKPPAWVREIPIRPPTAPAPSIGTTTSARKPRMLACSRIRGSQDGSVSTSMMCWTRRVSTVRPWGVSSLGGRGVPSSARNASAAPGQPAARRHHPEEAVFVAEDRDRPGAEQPHRAVRDALEDRLDVGGRARDHGQDLGGGGLALQRLAQRVLEPGALRPLLDERGLQGLDQLRELGIALWRHRSTPGRADWRAHSSTAVSAPSSRAPPPRARTCAGPRPRGP